MAFERLLPADDLAHVFDDGLALDDILQCKYAPAVNSRAAGLNSAPGPGTGDLGHGGKNFVNVNSYGRARVCAHVCVCTRAHARLWIVVR